MNDLFDTEEQTKHQPLAAVLRPRTLDDVIDQEALVAPGLIQRRRIAVGQLGSLILYGPPGIGNTPRSRAP